MKNFCLFCWLAPIEKAWTTYKNYIFELGWRFFLGIKRWFIYGGLHRLLVFIALVLCMIAIDWLWEKFKKWLDKEGK